MTAATNRRAVLIRGALHVALALTWLGAFVATHIPRGDVPPIGVSDKTLHALGYFVLATLLLLTLAARGAARVRRAALTAAVLAAYAAVDEITQALVNRQPAVDDWLADVLGAAAAIALWEVVLAIYARRRPTAAASHTRRR